MYEPPVSVKLNRTAKLVESFQVGKTLFMKWNSDIYHENYFVKKRPTLFGLRNRTSYITSLEYAATKFEHDNPGRLEQHWYGYKSAPTKEKSNDE